MEHNFNIIVDEIYSYQSGIYKRGYNSFTKPHFKKYQNEILFQLPTLNFDLEKETPIHLELGFFFKIPKSYSKKRKEELKNGGFCLKNIDLDNIAKGIIDVIAKKYNFNDKNIVFLKLSKNWNEEDKNEIKVKIERR